MNQVKTIKDMLARGEDPKDMLIEFCRPSCQFWEDKLKRCEVKLKSMEDADPTKSCMYPLRDWVTCVDGCANPKIQNLLTGQEKGWYSQLTYQTKLCSQKYIIFKSTKGYIYLYQFQNYL